jgi:diguanylate cyclase (GGDEF)-like protein
MHSEFATTMKDGARTIESVESELSEATSHLATLYAALDNVDSGLLILDGKLRAVYSNPALHRMFKSFNAVEIRSRKLSYEELLRAARTASAVDLQDYVAKRLAWVRSGDPTPMDLKMSNGTTLRCHLAVLPDGGRMLIYSDVTDIVRHAEELERLATTDGMTGIYNRRHFMTLADLEWNKACRYDRPLSLVLLDIDYFKSINDAYGHQAGDEVLVHLAKVAASCKRAPDILARIGGEEFALLLPETDLLQAQMAAERLRNEVATHPLATAPQAIRPTVSIGVAAKAANITTFSQLVTAADKALYEANRAGRNRVICAFGSPDEPSRAHSAQQPSPAPAE